MAIKSNFANLAPSLLLDFANTKTLDPRITFTRTTTGTVYDGKTVAKAEENLFLYSQQFDNAYWVKTNTTVTANTDTAPDGTSTAETLAATAIDGTLGTTVTAPTGQYTFSVWIKRKTGTGNVNIALQVGLGYTTVAVDGTWQRFSLTKTTTTTTPSINIQLQTSGDEVYIWGAQLEQRSAVSAYTATTTAPITNYIPQLLTAAAGQPRFDHNPTTGESLGLLIEEQRANLLTYSAQFDNAAWTKDRATITANTIVAPDGTLTGDKFYENTDTNTHRCNQSVSGTTNTNPYTGSFYAKKGERTKVAFAIVEGTTFTRQADCIFDLDTGTAGSVTVSGGATGSASITSVGNGWYRCALTTTLGGTDTNIFYNLRLVTGTNTTNYTGDGYSGIYIWGAQLEAGAFPTSYIPTTTASVTRNADAASMTGTNFSSWYRADEGSFYCAFSGVQNTAASVFALDDGTTSQRILNIFNGVTTQMAFRVVNGGTDQANFSPSSFTALSAVKYAATYKVNDFAAVTNGGTVATDTSGTIPVVTIARIGQNVAGGAFVNGYLSKLAYYPARLTNTQIQNLTA